MQSLVIRKLSLCSKPIIQSARRLCFFYKKRVSCVITLAIQLINSTCPPGGMYEYMDIHSRVLYAINDLFK